MSKHYRNEIQKKKKKKVRNKLLNLKDFEKRKTILQIAYDVLFLLAAMTVLYLLVTCKLTLI